VTDIILRICEPHTLLSHLAAYGLAAILEKEQAAGVQVGWTTGANPRPFAAVPDTDNAAELTSIRHDLDCAARLTCGNACCGPHPKGAAPWDNLKVFPQLSRMIRERLTLV
jgi:hypothetical protein